MSDETVELYVRNSASRTLLNLHAGDEAIAAAEIAKKSGLPQAFLELTVLPEWITDLDQRVAYQNSGELIHVRIPLHGGSLPLFKRKS